MIVIQDELRQGFMRSRTWAGRCPSSAPRAPRPTIRVPAGARALAPARPRRASRSSPAAAPGSWRRPTAARATPACRRSASASTSAEQGSTRTRHRARLPLLLRAQGHVRPLRERLRRASRRLRHARRAVRGGDAAPDAEDPPLPDRALRDRYWRGLVDWLRDPVVAEGNIGPGDIEALEVHDTTREVLETLEDVEHRRPRAA